MSKQTVIWWHGAAVIFTCAVRTRALMSMANRSRGSGFDLLAVLSQTHVNLASATSLSHPVSKTKSILFWDSTPFADRSRLRCLTILASGRAKLGMRTSAHRPSLSLSTVCQPLYPCLSLSVLMRESTQSFFLLLLDWLYQLCAAIQHKVRGFSYKQANRRERIDQGKPLRSACCSHEYMTGNALYVWHLVPDITARLKVMFSDLPGQRICFLFCFPCLPQLSKSTPLLWFSTKRLMSSSTTRTPHCTRQRCHLLLI